ncbi:MAG: NUDIX hydrolase [Mycolicibacterium sp.]|nr:NUDIX hydrolase [Mycolicibacterium sp.]
MTDWTAEGLGQFPPVDRWAVGDSERLYDNRWVALDLVEVSPPGQPAYRHHVVRIPHAIGVIVRRDDGKVLLMRRHRFVTQTVGFEIPAGGIDAGESAEDAARREVLEETGLTLSHMRTIYTVSPSDGVTDQRFHLLLGDVAADTGVVADPHESSGRVWLDAAELGQILRGGNVPGALTSVALLYALWSGQL